MKKIVFSLCLGLLFTFISYVVSVINTPPCCDLGYSIGLPLVFYEFPGGMPFPGQQGNLNINYLFFDIVIWIFVSYVLISLISLFRTQSKNKKNKFFPR